MRYADAKEVAREVARLYPASKRRYAELQADRIAFQLHLVTSRIGTTGDFCDIGGGISPLSLACARVGMDVIVIDDYRDEFYTTDPETAATIELLRENGVTVRTRNILEDDLSLTSESIDAVGCFSVMEHLHASPKMLFRQLTGDALRAGGWFFLSGPNCVNLRKRLSVPFGYGKWSRMDVWYDTEEFRSHVREPDVEDLRYIADDLALTNVEIKGRNDMAAFHDSLVIRHATRVLDPVLRLRPSLCMEIYILGRVQSEVEHGKGA